jgi:HSP20 family protein
LLSISGAGRVWDRREIACVAPSACRPAQACEHPSTKNAFTEGVPEEVVLFVKRRCPMVRTLIPLGETFPRTFARFENEMNEMMEGFLGRGEPRWIPEPFVPTANLVETENELEVTIDLPGLKPEEVKVELREGHLWVTGERKEETEEKGKTFHRMERRYGAFRRVILLPAPVNEEKVEAEFRDGVLKVRLPKIEEVKPRHIAVKS